MLKLKKLISLGLKHRAQLLNSGPSLTAPLQNTLNFTQYNQAKSFLLATAKPRLFCWIARQRGEIWFVSSEENVFTDALFTLLWDNMKATWSMERYWHCREWETFAPQDSPKPRSRFRIPTTSWLSFCHSQSEEHDGLKYSLARYACKNGLWYFRRLYTMCPHSWKWQ